MQRQLEHLQQKLTKMQEEGARSQTDRPVPQGAGSAGEREPGRRQRAESSRGAARGPERGAAEQERLMEQVSQLARQLESGMGEEAAAVLRRLGDPQQLSGLLGRLGEGDLRRLERLLQNPERLRGLLNDETLEALKKALGG
ncbi:MAG: hypothetical protein IJL15_05335 [Clostridia bacterium]|nr:hypothetical protein [Clostridia bacterium]